MVEFASAAQTFGPYMVISVLAYAVRFLMVRSDAKEIQHAAAMVAAASDLKSSQEARIKENNENGKLLASTSEALRLSHAVIERTNAAAAALELRFQNMLKREAS